MENFIYTFQIDEKLCDDLIQYHKDNKEYCTNGAVGGKIDKTKKDSTDVYFFNQSQNPTIKKYFNELQKGFDSYRYKFNIQNLKLRTEVGNNLQYYPIGGGFKIWHFERDTDEIRRCLVYMTYLNDVPDGGTEWLYQNFKLEARKGLSVIWPAEWTHTHRGIVSHTSEKWIATGWFELI
jgi:hypothetical protein